jgi:5-methylcytosine-specific restriction endonuclease McrA
MRAILATSESKQCYRCGRSKSLRAFIRRRDGRCYDMCRSCVRIILARPRKATGQRKRLRHTASHRTCYLCNRHLPVSEFTRRSNGTYFSACKDCNRLVFSQRRRARLLSAEGEFTQAEWQAILAKYPQCPGCRRDWESIPLLKGRRSVVTVDHVQALSKGGRNDASNIQPLCYSCNSRKGDR